MNCFDVLEQLEKTPGKNDKRALLAANLDTPGMAYLLLATFNYQWKYYVRDIPESVIRRVGTTGIEIINDHELLAMFESFEARLRLLQKSGRTQETKEAVLNWLRGLTPLAAKWFRRAILRDLRCGFSVDSCIVAGYKIPVFEAQLAMDAKKCKNLEKIVKAGVYVNPKLDGYRCLAVIEDGVATLYSRNGTEFENFPTVKAELERMAAGQSIVLDGEIMSTDFNAMQQTAFASKRGTAVGDVAYHVFDAITVDEWFSGNFKMLYGERLKLAYGFVGCQSATVVWVPWTLVHSVEEITKQQADFEALGYEGAMAKPNLPYYMGRKTNAVMKFKSMQTWDCEIVGFVEGEGRLAGMLGKVEVRQENGETCGVGTGFIDSEREAIWLDRSGTLGRIIEVKYQDLGKDGVMRFPVFMRFRDKASGGGKI